MGYVVEFLSSDIGKFIATSGVVVALVTSIVNIFDIRSTNRRVLEIEKYKQDADIITFRYTKLYEASLELEKIPAIIYDLNDIQKLSDDINDPCLSG